MSKHTADEQFTVNAALGRIFKLMSRPAQLGDEAEYERCRAAVLDVVQPIDPLAHRATEVTTPDYIRDRRRGAAGD